MVIITQRPEYLKIAWDIKKGRVRNDSDFYDPIESEIKCISPCQINLQAYFLTDKGSMHPQGSTQQQRNGLLSGL